MLQIISSISYVKDEAFRQTLISLGLLLLRAGVAGIMLFSHGLGKLMKFSELSSQFPDPLGVGNFMSLTLAVGAEVACSALVVIGLLTRLATIPLIITMCVAAFIIHANDPWQKQEFPILFLIAFVALLFTGPGRFSLDAKLFGKKA